uniref:FYVE-type domain-containing protein n=1 Tax=Phytophthora ramorum TaxID=164328 RepID=H3HAP0_PHYRM
MLSSAKSLDDEAARLAVLRDPKRMAALLVRAFSSSMVEEAVTGDGVRRKSLPRQEEDDEEVEETQEEFQELERRASAGEATPLRVVIRPVAADDDDDDAEEEEEEEEEEENADRPLDEEELEAAATALQTATRIVEELRLKMLLKAGQQMDRQQQGTDNEPPFSSAGSVIGCGKSFNPFHRSKNCAACGYAFCPKCSSKNVVLPTSFGYRDEAVRTCDPCAQWFQKALDRYFDAMELAKGQDQDLSVHRGSMGEITIEEKPRTLSTYSNSPVPASSTSDGNLSLNAFHFKATSPAFIDNFCPISIDE